VITAATTFMDEPKTFTFDDQEYSPGNFGDQYTYAPVTLRDALVRSLNVVTVEVANEVTIGRVMNLAAKAGLPKPARPYLAMALGTNEATPLQIASAYTAFAQNGVRVTPVAIDRITTGRGETVVAPVGQKNEVLTPEVAFIMTSMMKDVVNRGTAARLRARGFRANVAGKTGTSRDGWFAGYTPSLVCVVWVGFDDGSQLGLTGADSALPIWADFMTAALNEHPEWAGDWQMPAGIETAEIDPTTGQLAAPDSPNKRLEYFIRGTAPTVQSQAPPEASPTPEIEMPDAPPPDLPMPEASPAEPTQGAERPRLESRSLSQPDGSARSVGTITLDIDPTTGLIAAPTCPVIRSKTFIIGQEPRRYCGPQYHTGRSGALGEREPPRSDGSSRPRLIAPRGP
jgi:penicillin-binding protein 1B